MNEQPAENGQRNPPTPEEENHLLKVALEAIGFDGVPGLSKMLEHKDWRARATAAWLLTQLDPFPEAAVPAMLKAMEDPDWSVRKTAGYCLEHYFNPQAWARLGRPPNQWVTVSTPKPDPELFLRALVARVDDKSAEIRVMAMGLLGRLGEAAKSALPLVTERLNDADKSVQFYARQAFVQIDPAGAEAAGVKWP